MKSPFDVAKEITGSKRPWNENIQKAWNTFMINRILSMNPDNIELINAIQFYFRIPERSLYSIYCDIFPKSGFHPYIKSNTENGKYTAKNIKDVQIQFGVNKQEAHTYLFVYGKDILDSMRDGSGGDFTLTKIKKGGNKSNKRKA